MLCIYNIESQIKDLSEAKTLPMQKGFGELEVNPNLQGKLTYLTSILTRRKTKILGKSRFRIG